MEQKCFTATAMVLNMATEVVLFYFRHRGTTAALPADDLADCNWLVKKKVSRNQSTNSAHATKKMWMKK